MRVGASTAGRQAATSKMKDKAGAATAAAAGKGRAVAKEKEKQTQLEVIVDQFNTAMPHWTLHVVSDSDTAVSVDTVMHSTCQSTFCVYDLHSCGMCVCMLWRMHRHDMAA